MESSARHGQTPYVRITFRVKGIKLGDQTGTGFVVSANGHLVTNHHVIDGCVGDIQGNLTGEAPVKLRVVSSDETNDLALLQAPSPFKEVATIKEKAVHSGDSVVAIGFPYRGLLSSDFTVTTGIVSSLSGIMNDTRFLQISAAVQPGNSGGPLLSSTGEIVGVVAAKLLAARVAWAAADNSLQVHGGNGFALEYPISRVLCDARILNIFEGAAEIQAQVIARRLLES